MIVLDWTRPWSFVEELQTWLLWVERWVKGDGSRELEMVREECRERCKYKYEAVLVPRLTRPQYSHIYNIILNHLPIRCLHLPLR